MTNMSTSTVAAVISAAAVAFVSPCLSEAGEGIDSFVLTLARNDVPAGLVAPDAVIARLAAGPFSAASAQAKSQFRGTLGTAVREFNASAPGFEASVDGGVVHVRSASEPRSVSELLTRTWVQKEDAEIPALTAINRYVLGAMGGFEPPGGVIGAGMFPDEDSPAYQRVKLARGSTTARQMLDEIVKQVRGLVWFVSYKPDSANADVQIGLICPDGAMVRVPVPE
jgi:hypothetical protein